MSEPISSQPAESNSQRIYLHVPYAQKDAARQLGAKWSWTLEVDRLQWLESSHARWYNDEQSADRK
jgi:Domain of unknown function (DUF5710)